MAPLFLPSPTLPPPRPRDTATPGSTMVPSPEHADPALWAQSSHPIYATRTTQDRESVGEKLTINCSTEFCNHGLGWIHSGEVAPASIS
jgi:hypothetical protein